MEANVVLAGIDETIDNVATDVGALVILRIERDARAEVAAEVVHGREVQPHDTERAGHQHGVAPGGCDAFLARGAVDHQVVAHPVAEILRLRRSEGGRGCGSLLCAPGAEVAGQPHRGADGVDAGIGIARVAVAVMGHVDARLETGVRVDGPVEEYAQVDVGIYLAAHQLVPRVVLRIELLPAEGRAEVPLIVQRQARSQGSNAGRLEGIDGHGIAQLGGIEKSVVCHADALHDVGEHPSPIRVRRKAEAVLQVTGKVGVDGAVRLVVPP